MFSNRRPYYGLKLSIADFFREPVRYIKQSNTKESQFEKPYLIGEYSKMHLKLPEGKFESYKRRKFRTPGAFGPISEGVHTYWDMSNTSGCGIISAQGRRGGGLGLIGSGFGGFVGYGFGLGCDDETDITFGAPSFSSDEDWIWNFSVYSSEVNTGNISLTPLNSNTVTLKITGDADGELNFCGVGTNVRTGAKLFCCHAVLVNCITDPCVDIIPMTWDNDASADTITKSASVGVAVKDGLGPYNWSVSGTGFTMESAQTSGVSNTVIADGSACGSATITVTDQCGGLVTGYVRCTTGQWVAKDSGSGLNPSCQLSGAATGYVPGIYIMSGNKRYVENISHKTVCSPSDTPCSTDCVQPCITSYDCSKANPAGWWTGGSLLGGCCCEATWGQYYSMEVDTWNLHEWEC